MKSVHYDRFANRSELYKLCLHCETEDCQQICLRYKNTCRALAGLPPLTRQRGVRKPRNRSHRKYYTAFGETHTLYQWAKLYGINYATLYGRVVQSGAELEPALTMGRFLRMDGSSLFTAFGKSLSLKAWEAETGVPAKAIRHRIQDLGWPVEEAVSTPILPKGHHRPGIRRKAKGGEACVD